jgi:hypothetical protein
VTAEELEKIVDPTSVLMNLKASTFDECLTVSALWSKNIRPLLIPAYLSRASAHAKRQFPQRPGIMSRFLTQGPRQSLASSCSLGEARWECRFVAIFQLCIWCFSSGRHRMR